MNSASALGTEGQARWSLRVFGGFELSALPAGEKLTGLGKRERVLLAYLALNPKGREQRRKLTTLLWGDSADETTLDNLRNCLYGLRKVLGDSERTVLLSDGEELALDAAAFDIDVLSFRSLAAQSGRAELEAAVKLYSGGLLDGLDIESEEYESWRRTEAQRFRDQAVDALNRLMAQLAESGETDRAIETGQRILALDPLHEGAVRRLMRLYAQTGRRSTAIQLYRTLADALKADLGAQPEAETRAVFDEISRGDEQPIASAANVATAPPSPSIARASEPSPTRGAPTVPFWRTKWSARNWVIAGGLAAAIALILSYLFMPGVTSRLPEGAIAVAVLPFDNLSSDPEQQFFSDGITEEITSALARIPDLGVVARTSAFQFKGQNRDLRAVGQSLGATHLIEGSVRKAGDRVRITAQLIQADDGLHVWTNSYDRNLTDIFAIQEEIAVAIAGALRMPLGLQPGQTLVSNRGIDPESYEQYLRAKALLVSRVGAAADALNIMEQVVARNPDYAPAWASLSGIYRRLGNASRQEAAARRAIELDPNLADGYGALGVVELGREKWVLAEELYLKALALDPNSVLFAYGNLLGAVGRLKEALAIYQRLRALEPLVPLFNGNLSDALWLNGQDEAAIAILKASPAGGLAPGMTPGGLGEIANIYASMGRYSEAADAAQQLSTMNVSPEVAAISKEAARLLRTAPAKSASPQNLPRLGPAGFVYLYIGAESRVLEEYEERAEAGFFNPGPLSLLWHPSYAPVRKMERFKAYVRKAGLVEYWRVKGWPEFCHPIGADDFVCE